MHPDHRADSILGTALTRRHLLSHSAQGLGFAALAALLSSPASATRSQEAAAPTVLRPGPRARRAIYLFMSGGPSQLDLFDPKPKLQAMSGQPMPKSLTEGQRVAQLMGHELRCVGSRFRFSRHGRCGAEISELLPHTARVADDLAIVRSVHTDAIDHDPAVTLMQTGSPQPGRPAMGAWVSYGLGSESSDLPAFVVLTSSDGTDQPLLSRYWGNGFLPSSHQGVELRSQGEPVLFVQDPAGIDRRTRRRMLDGVRDLNRLKLELTGDAEIATRIQSFELAYRMQASIPELLAFGNEPRATLERYGATPGKASFANNCLLARRLVERGVRFVQLYHRGWDQHGNLPRDLARQCQITDQPCAALIEDLKERGLLDDTLVVWSGEFGRTPMSQGETTNDNYGRDHHMKAFTAWLAGGGIRGGMTFGATDELGYNIASDPVHINDLQATILHCLGLKHERLTFRFQGRDFRLTDVGGDVLGSILA